MKLTVTNLPDINREALKEDLADLEKAAGSIKLPSSSLVVISLQQDVKLELPDHALSKPEERPVSFRAICEWEEQCQSFQIIEGDNTIFCIGTGDSGAYYAFLEALHCLTGVLWTGVNEEDIIFSEPTSLPDTVQTPDLAFRCRDGMGPTNHRDFLKWLGRNRYNMWRRNSSCWVDYSPETREQLTRHCRSRFIQLTLGDHAMHYWLPEEEFNKHPDWFGMRDGQRVRKGHVSIPECPHLNSILPIQPCYANKELVDYITDRMATHIKQNPYASVFAIWPHDGVNNWCQCSECLKKTPFEHMYEIALRLLNKTPTTVPVELIAYSNLLNLPYKPLPANDRIFVMLCPYLRHYRYHIYDNGGPELMTGNNYPDDDRINPVDDREYGLLFDAWASVCRRSMTELAIFEYGATFYDETRRTDRTRYFYHPSPQLVYDELQWYADKRVSLYYLCGHFRGWPDLFHEYSLAQMLWSRSNTPDQCAARYYQAIASGEDATTLLRLLKGIAQKLMDEETPGILAEQLRALLPGLKDRQQAQRYSLWLDYVLKGCLSRSLEKQGDYQGVINQEDAISALLDKHQDLINHYLTNGVLSYTGINRQRAEEKLAQTTSQDYTM